MILTPRHLVSRPKRPPCITLREFAESVGVGYHSLRGRFALTPRSSRPSPTLPNADPSRGTVHQVNWYAKKDLAAWWTQRQNNKQQKGTLHEANMGL